MKWWWDPHCTRPTLLVGFFIVNITKFNCYYGYFFVFPVFILCKMCLHHFQNVIKTEVILNNKLTKMYCTQKYSIDISYTEIYSCWKHFLSFRRVYLKSKDKSEMHSTSNGINDNMSVQTNGTISETRSTDIFSTTL